MSGGTRHSSAVSPGGHRTLGDGQHSDTGMGLELENYLDHI